MKEGIQKVFVRSGNKGFTLVEILVATMIGVFIALVAVSALKTMTVSAEMVNNNIETTSELRFARRMLERDLQNIYRYVQYSDMRFFGAIEESEGGITSRLIFYTVGRTKARSGEPEGDIYEVEYYLAKSDQSSGLMRRLWPNPNQDVVEGGGILTMIADDIDVFEVKYFNGVEWQYDWPEDMRTIPQLVEVNIARKLKGQNKIMGESFLVNFVKSSGNELGMSEGSGNIE